MTIKEIAHKIKGEVVGNEQQYISFPAKIEEAQNSNITFLANEKYLSFLQTTKAGAVVISKGLYERVKHETDLNWIIVDDPYLAFTKILSLFDNSNLSSIFSPQFKIGEHTIVYPQVYIGDNVTIGEHCIIYPNVTIYKDCVIGDRCIIHSGVIIGADGFGFAPQKDGSYEKIPQLGNVVIEDDCEIGANTCIDRATMGSTIIRKGVKLDNLIHVAHNVEIGEHTVIAAQTGISGSTKIGHHNMIGGQVGFVGHVVVAPYTKINAQSAVAQHIKKEGLVLSGSPVMDMKQHFKAMVIYKNLPELERRVRELENQVKEIPEK